MAAPVVNSISKSVDPVSPGGTTRVTIDATDPDSTVHNFVVNVTDSQANTTQAGFDVTVSDPLTYGVDPVTGWTITQVAGSPNQFDLTAP